MKKKILIILSLIVPFVLSIRAVNAEDDIGGSLCKDIVCEYNEGNCPFCTQKKTIITQKKQNDKCTISVKYDGNEITNYSMKNKEKNSTGYDESSKKIVFCPPCLDYSNGSITFTVKNKDSVYCPNSYLPVTKVGGEEGEKKAEREKEAAEKEAQSKRKCLYKRYVSGVLGTEVTVVDIYDNGTKKYYQGYNYESQTSEVTITNEDFSKTKLYNTSDKTFSDCPKCLRLNVGNKSAEFADPTGTSSDGNVNAFECPATDFGKLTSENDHGSGDTSKDDKLECDGNWNMVCRYGEKENHDLMLILKINSNNEFSMYRTGDFVPPNQITTTIDGTALGGKCPSVIYSEYNDSISGSSNQSHNEETFYLKKDKPVSTDRSYVMTSYINCSEEGKPIEVWDINNCQDLFGDEIVEIINTVMKYIRMIVPILLLIYGTTDFFTAVFSSSEDEMSEKRKRFFKRLAAALIVFLVPIFVNLVLKLANSVWSNIHPETCINTYN